jgi:uncharacterized protein with PIN domain
MLERTWMRFSNSERRDLDHFARLPTALRPRQPVQQWVFHQAKMKLTPLPVLRYSFGHRKGRLKILSIIHKAQIEIAPFDQEQAEVARDAYRTYGKGRHPAGLNYGDCFSYALSSIRGEPLLYKGEDFGKTDVKSALEQTIHQ